MPEKKLLANTPQGSTASNEAAQTCSKKGSEDSHARKLYRTNKLVIDN
jgi:hypothetical protein